MLVRNKTFAHATLDIMNMRNNIFNIIVFIQQFCSGFLSNFWNASNTINTIAHQR